MQTTKIFTAVVAVGSLVLLAGCAKYKAQPLQRLSTQQTSDKVALSYKVFDKKDCKDFLGRKNILRKGYQPVQLMITNNSDHTYTYSATSLSLPTVPAELVAKKVHFSTVGRVIGYAAVATAIFAPVIVLTIAGHGNPFDMSEVLYIPASAAATPFIAMAIGDGVKSSKANKHLKADFAKKAFPAVATLNPHETLNAIIFVPKKEFTTNFTITLKDQKTEQPLVVTAHSTTNPFIK